MTMDQALAEKPCVGVSVTPTPNGLAAIKDRGCSAAIWKRAPNPAFQKWIDGLDPADLPRARVIVRSDMVREAMTEIAMAYGLHDSDEGRILIADITGLAAVFADIMDSRYLRLRLDVIETNACRKFHIDAVTARLICTYRGHATQYGNARIGDDPGHIHDVPTGSPMILRGTTWPSAADPGLLHRSPPIEGTGETRLVLVLDPVADSAVDQADGFLH